MAMLAEPRRKQKWSVDPRNSTWSKDESKFGQKMLEKMGWSKGKGLGAQEQGSTEHIRVQVKNNTLGLGASVNHEDNWIAHQDDFNQILAELNNFHGGADSDPPPNEEKKSFSLEEKSKSSKKRVHYMKFAKGKDLSCRSDTDLACIFGKREKTKKTSSPQEEHEVDSKESEENKSESPSEECESGNTVTSTLSVSEYFAKRMAELKRSRGLKTDPDRPKTTDAPDNAAKDAVKKPKKKKRDKRGGGGLLPEEQEVPETQETSNSNAECEKPRKKSKKKRKNKEFRPEDAERVGEEEARASDAAANQGETPQKKKNKRKKSNERSEDDTPETSAYSAEPKKKKNKKAV